MRRFAQHILPAGFRKVRKYGLVSNASKKKDLPLARKALRQVYIPVLSTRKERKAKALNRMFGKEKDRCVCCKIGKMIPLYTLLKEEVEAIESQTKAGSDFPQERAPAQQNVLVPPK